MDPNTPVLVGVAAVQQKIADYDQALEPVALMEQALRQAADDAGAPGLLQRSSEILVPKGIWGYSDPGRLLADALGAGQAATVLGEIGVSQQTLLTRACQRIASGEAQVVLVTGAEAKYRSLCAAKAGAEASETAQQDVEPTEALLPDDELWSPVESAAGLGMPVGYYAIMDSALRYQQGMSPDVHRDQMAAMYQRFSEIAADNPDAWAEDPVEAAFIRDASPANRMLAFPYTKLHNSQWNVDQGAGLIFCSVAIAQELGIDRSRWIFPRAFAESNFMSVVSARGDLGSCPGFRIAGAAAASRAGVSFDDIRLRELYSCFPYAVRSQLHEFALSGEGDLSVTGAMTFGGGPLNNFVYQATVKMAQLLRESPEEVGLVTTVSGMLTKQGVALWSATPGPAGWGFDDVTEQVRGESDIREVVADFDGDASVAGYTVLYQGADPWRAVAVFDLPDGNRTVAFSEDAAAIAQMESGECCGLSCSLSGGQFTLAL
jgi:acetyl-CoA C-acetyltransferase